MPCPLLCLAFSGPTAVSFPGFQNSSWLSWADSPGRQVAAGLLGSAASAALILCCFPELIRVLAVLHHGKAHCCPARAVSIWNLTSPSLDSLPPALPKPPRSFIKLQMSTPALVSVNLSLQCAWCSKLRYRNIACYASIYVSPSKLYPPIFITQVSNPLMSFQVHMNIILRHISTKILGGRITSLCLLCTRNSHISLLLA